MYHEHQLCDRHSAVPWIRYLPRPKTQHRIRQTPKKEGVGKLWGFIEGKLLGTPGGGKGYLLITSYRCDSQQFLEQCALHMVRMEPLIQVITQERLQGIYSLKRVFKKSILNRPTELGRDTSYTPSNESNERLLQTQRRKTKLANQYTHLRALRRVGGAGV